MYIRGAVMSFLPVSVANCLLEFGARDGIAISPMKMQKLVFYSHGWHLGFTGEPLIDEQIECWRYGPVVDSLFHEFKGFGSAPITRMATRSRIVTKKNGALPRRVREFYVPNVPDGKSRSIIEAVWDSYKNFSAEKLSNMTHAAGEPWRVTYEEYQCRPPRSTDIPLDRIRTHFKSQLEATE